MAQIPLNQDEVVENIYATNVWRVPGISQFITKNILNLTRCYLTIVDTRLSNHPIVTRRLNESKTLSTLDHPSIYKIEIYQRKFSSAEILALKELYAEPDMPLFPPSKNSEDTDMEAICIKMEQPHNVSATGFVLTNHYRKDSPIFHQQQIVMIQNLVQVVNYLHKKVIPIRDLVAHALFSGESETNLNSPLVKVNVSLAAFPHVASIPLPDDNVKRSRYHEDIAKLSTLFKSILMYGNSMILNVQELIALPRHITTDQIKVQISSEDNKFKQLMSILRDPDGTDWLNDLKFTQKLGKGSFGFVMAAIDQNQGHKTVVKIIAGQIIDNLDDLDEDDDDDDDEDSDEDENEDGDKDAEDEMFKARREFENMKSCQHPNLTKLYRFKEKTYSRQDIKGGPNVSPEEFFRKSLR